MGKELDLTIRGHDDASKALRDVKEGTKGLVEATDKQTEATGKATLKWTEMLSALTLARQGVRAVQQTLQATIGAWLDHTMAVSEFNSMIDGNIEETSVLMELYDDFGVTMDTGLAAMRSLAKNGYEPNIEGLIELRAQLDNTTNAADRLKLAQELIGEQGIKQIIPMLDQLTNEQLRNYVDTLTEAELITKKEEETAQEMRTALSGMGDAWDNVTLSVGGWMALQLIPALEATGNAIRGVRVEVEGTHRGMVQTTEESGELSSALGGLEEQADDTGDAIEGVKQSVEDLEEAELLLKSAQALIAGDTVMAKFWAGMAREAEIYSENIAGVIALLDQYNGKVVSAEMMLRIKTLGGAFDPNAFERQLWQERHEAIPAGGGGDGVRYVRDDRPYAQGGGLYKVTEKGWERVGYELGGKFTIGGSGGPDSELVQFRGTPGEEVKVTPPGKNGAGDDALLREMRAMRLEFGRLANTLPTILRDAVERAL